MFESTKRPPGRLAWRIRWLLVGLAVLQAAVFAGAGWLLLLTVEERVQNHYHAQLLERAAQAGPTAPLPHGVIRYTSRESISQTMGLADPPTERGLYPAFGDSAVPRTEVMEGVLDYLYWTDWSGLEEEYAIWVESSAAAESVVWLVTPVDDYTDAISGFLRFALLLAVLVVIVVAISTGSLIARWALKPIVALAKRVEKRIPDLKSDSLDPKRTARKDHDEVGFLEGALEAYEVRLRETLARERDFLTDCSHELRTPVATLKGAVALLQTSTDNSARERSLARIERSVHRMERLIEIFLMVAREGHNGTPRQTVDAAEVVAEVVDEIRALYPTHPLRIQVFVSETVQITCHREVLAVLCHNLIGNAFTHLSSGELHVRLEVVDEGGRLRVADNGPGLPEFGDIEVTSAPGHGHGLTLVERLCRTHRWRLNKEPRPEGGTCIDVIFPRTGA